MVNNSEGFLGFEYPSYTMKRGGGEEAGEEEGKRKCELTVSEL